MCNLPSEQKNCPCVSRPYDLQEGWCHAEIRVSPIESHHTTPWPGSCRVSLVIGSSGENLDSGGGARMPNNHVSHLSRYKGGVSSIVYSDLPLQQPSTPMLCRRLLSQPQVPISLTFDGTVWYEGVQTLTQGKKSSIAHAMITATINAKRHALSGVSRLCRFLKHSPLASVVYQIHEAASEHRYLALRYQPGFQATRQHDLGSSARNYSAMIARNGFVR